MLPVMRKGNTRQKSEKGRSHGVQGPGKSCACLDPVTATADEPCQPNHATMDKIKVCQQGVLRVEYNRYRFVLL